MSDINSISDIKINDQQIPIAFAFTKNYIVQAAVTMLSILSNANEKEGFHFICLSAEDLPQEYKEALATLKIRNENLNFTFLSLEGRYEFEHSGRFTNAAYYRLLLPMIFPNLDKIMYIDCDTVVQSDLAALYRNTNLTNHYLAAVKEFVLDFQMDHLKNIGCDPDNYFNSGFLLLNLELLRKDDLVSKFMEASKSDVYIFPDQDILNIYCAHRTIWLPPLYNGINVFRVPAYRSLFNAKFENEDWDLLKIIGTIHYTGDRKPWNNYTLDFEKWWQYYKLLPLPIRDFQTKNLAFAKMKILAFLWRSSLFVKLINLLKTIKSKF